ncbi:hypothetical protein FJZ53_07150 [Candidatus Woesearchaeota archaeon]|nr:hypothetical protein [Candidatus Woesearchaeota archaeon]
MGNGITEKQLIALKRFAKNPELSQGILKGVKFDGLSKEEASELIKKCLGQNNSSEGVLTGDSADFVIRFGQNYKDGDVFKTVFLTSEELEAIRNAHREHCAEVLRECEDDYPDDRELQLAMFDKRTDKIFTWLQQALDEY